MRKAGRVVAEMHDRIRAAIRPGVTTADLDQIGRDVLDRAGAKSNFLGYHGYPGGDLRLAERGGRPRHPRAVACSRRATSSRSTAGRSSTAGTATPRSPRRSAGSTTRAPRLMEVTEAASRAGIAQMVDGNRLVRHRPRRAGGGRAAGLLGGPGLRRPRHRHGHAREPRRAELRPAAARARSSAGQVFAVEPMVNAGAPTPWCSTTAGRVVTADGRCSAHFEHTIAITDNGPEILTLP